MLRSFHYYWRHVRLVRLISNCLLLMLTCLATCLENMTSIQLASGKLSLCSQRTETSDWHHGAKKGSIEWQTDYSKQINRFGHDQINTECCLLVHNIIDGLWKQISSPSCHEQVRTGLTVPTRWWLLLLIDCQADCFNDHCVRKRK